MPGPLVQIQNYFTESFLVIPSAEMHKWFRFTEHRVLKALDKKCLLTTSPSEPLVQIQNNFKELFLIMPSTKIAQMVSLHRTKGTPEL